VRGQSSLTSSRDFALDRRDTSIWLACRGLPTSCRRPGHFSLLAQRKVTKRKGPPDGAPSGLRPPGARSGYGVFRQDIPVLSKNWPHPCGHPAGFPPPARRVIRGPQKPSQIKSRTTPGGCARSIFVGAHPVRDHLSERNSPALRSRTRCAPTGGGRGPADGASTLRVGSLWERTLCATNLRSDTPMRDDRAQGALPQTSRHAGDHALAMRTPRPRRNTSIFRYPKPRRRPNVRHRTI
jgi:hypothetical protein